MLYPEQALLQYPELCQGPIQEPPHLGLNGGVCYRVQSLVGDLCLKAWPAVDQNLIVQAHRLLQQAAMDDLDFLPRVHATGAGPTFWRDPSGRFWDLTTWMPGKLLDRHVAVSQIRSAGTALARLHLSWARVEKPRLEPAPAVLNRLETWHVWRSFSWAKGNKTPEWLNDDLRKKTWSLLLRWMPQIQLWLWPWSNRPLPLHWRHGDPWAGNLLFAGNQLTGVIDFGAVAMDAPIADLARLLGSLAGNDVLLWQAGEDAYAAVRPLRREERELLPVLDRTGAIGALWLWLNRGSFNRLMADDRTNGAIQRLAELVERIEQWQ